MDIIALPATTPDLRDHLRHAHHLTDTTLAGADAARLVEMHQHEHALAGEFELAHTHPDRASAAAGTRAALAAARAQHVDALGSDLAGELAELVTTATGLAPARITVEVSDDGAELGVRQLVTTDGVTHDRARLPALDDVNEFDAPSSHEFCDLTGDGLHTLTVRGRPADPGDVAAELLEPHRRRIVAEAAAALADADQADVAWDGVQVMFEAVDGTPTAYPNVSAAIADPEVRDSVDTALERVMKADLRLTDTVEALADRLGDQLWDLTVHLPREPDDDDDGDDGDGSSGGGPGEAVTLVADALQVPADTIAGAVFAAVHDTGMPVHVQVTLTDGTDAYLYPDQPRAAGVFDHLLAVVDWDAPDDGYDDRGEWFLHHDGPGAERPGTHAGRPRVDETGTRWDSLADLKAHLHLLHGYTGSDYTGTDVVADDDGSFGWATALHTHAGDHGDHWQPQTAFHTHAPDGTVRLGHVVTWQPADPHGPDPAPFGAVSLPDADTARARAGQLQADHPGAVVAVVDATDVPVPPLAPGFSPGDLLDALDRHRPFHQAAAGGHDGDPGSPTTAGAGRLLDDPAALKASQRRRLARELADLLGISRMKAYTLVDLGLPAGRLDGRAEKVAALLARQR